MSRIGPEKLFSVSHLEVPEIEPRRNGAPNQRKRLRDIQAGAEPAACLDNRLKSLSIVRVVANFYPVIITGLIQLRELQAGNRRRNAIARRI